MMWLINRVPAIVFHAIIVLERAAKDIESTANGKVHTALTGVADGVQVGKTLSATGVSDGNVCVRGEDLDEIMINARLFAFHIHGVHKKLGAARCQLAENRFVHGQFCKCLPTIGDHPIPAAP